MRGAESHIPEELWRQILELGIRSSTLNEKDLCCLSITCRRLHRLSDEDSLWSYLLSSHFLPPHHTSSSSSSAKSAYKARYEREKEKKAVVHKRAVLRKESEVRELQRRIREIENQLIQEKDKLRAASSGLGNLHKVRQASVALKVWQPEVIRGKQNQLVEQCVVPVESRVHALEMEIRLCRQQISGFNKAYRDENRRLEIAMEELALMKYHPLRDYPMTGGAEDHVRKKKKLKKCINMPDDKQGKEGKGSRLDI